MNILTQNFIYKALIICFVFIFQFSNSFSQVSFNKHYDNDSIPNVAFCVFQTQDNGYILGGNTTNPSAGWQGSYLIRTDCAGDTIWEKVYVLSSTGANGFEFGVELLDGNYILCGYLQDTVQLSLDAFLMKINNKGEIIWLKTYGGAINEAAKMFKQTSDNGFIIVGYSSSYTNGGNDFYLIKTDSNGNFQWQQHYGGAGDDVGYSIDFAKNGGYILGGRTDSYGLGVVDLYMIKVDYAGNFQWQKTFGTTGDDYSETVISTLDSGYVMVGGVADAYGSYDAYIVKTDAFGNKIWDKTYGKTSNYEMLKYVVQLPDSSFTLSGSFWPDNTLKYQGWLLKTNKYGDSLWCQTYGNSGVSDYIYEMCKTTDGGYALAGQYNRIGPPYQDMWLIKTDSLGCDQPLCNFGCNACAYIQPHIWVFSDTVFLPNKTFAFQDSSDFALQWFWDFGDGTTDTVQNPVHIYDTTGTYIVKLISYYGNCSDSVFMNVYVVNNLNIINNNLSYTQFVKLYPNPAKENITIESSPSLNGNVLIFELTDLLGQVVLKTTFTSTGKNEISLKELSTGLYLYHISDNNGNILIEDKLVITNKK
ncbi:MAG: T9SS type A sorting domain-containing protein [Bacteroidota bacterium]